MKMPWTGRTGPEKALAIFAAVTLLSMASCAGNAVALIALYPNFNESLNQASVARTNLGDALLVTAGLEIVGMFVGIVGLVVAGVVAMVGRKER
jgi:hypothetical protein